MGGSIRTMTKLALVFGCVLAAGAVAWAHTEKEQLPAGPVRDRNDLMESIGHHADKIGKALKAGNKAAVGPEADAIAAEAKKVTALFPEGSTHPASRAKPEIWTQWADFQQRVDRLSTRAAALAQAARDGGDVKSALDQMFAECKGCHQAYRVPDKK